ncbi:MAG: glycosyltransferase, partial [Acidobacteria bacterium]|nr:glycosyltransferase [Acidobacteriota bacterium]
MIIRTVHRVRASLRDTVAVASTLRVITRELFRSARRGYRALSADIRRQPRPIRIGVDVRPFYEQLTGVGWYLYEVLHEISRMEDVELIAFGDPRMSATGPSLHGNLPETIEYRIFDMTGERASRWTHGLTGIAHPLMMKLERIDLFFGGNYFLPRTMDSVATRRVVTVHDLTYRKRPELLQAETLANLEKHMQRELSRADAVICVSHASRRDLIEEYPIEPARVFAIQNGM